MATSHRVRLLGELEVFTDSGAALGVAPDNVMQRLLVALALRAGQPRRTDDLIAAVWPGTNGFERHAKSLETPASRLRNKLELPIPPRRGAQAFSYRLDLRREQVDALDFIDAVQADALPVDEVQRLLGLWRGDPRVLFGALPASEWQGLNRAIERFCEHVNALGAQDLRQIRPALDAFQEIVPEAASAVRAAAPVAAAPKRRLLIVENEENVAERLGSILADFQCTLALSLAAAMREVTERLSEFDGALIDLHLTDRLDSAGLEVLAYIRDHRPELPRLLITASPPPGSQENMRRTYGIVDILIKGADGYSAVGVRDAVGTMFNESDGATRDRALARFDSHAIKIKRQLKQRLVGARRGIRSGDGSSYAAFDRANEDMEEFERDNDDVREEIANVPVADVDATIAKFAARWPLQQRSGGEPA